MRVLFLILSCLMAGNALGQAQEPAEPWLLGAYGHGSFIMQHSEAMHHLAVSHPVGFELNAQKQTLGKKNWHLLYRLPKIGYSLVYYNYRNAVLGHSLAASAYLNKTLLRTRNGELNYRLGLGIGYLTQGYNQESNHKNTVASTALNATMHTRFEYNYRIAPAFSVLAGLGLNHYSNGSFQKPNLGINLPVVSLGLNFHTNPSFTNRQLEALLLEQRNPNAAEELMPDRPVFYKISSTLGFRQINPSNKKKYAVQSVTVAIGKPLNLKSNLVAGAEGFYDRSIKVQQRSDSTLAGQPFPDVKKGGLYIGHELLFGDLAFEMQLGYYIYQPYKNATSYYERIGLTYQFSPHVFGAVNLKVHGFAADVLEWRIGYRF